MIEVYESTAGLLTEADRHLRGRRNARGWHGLKRGTAAVVKQSRGLVLVLLVEHGRGRIFCSLHDATTAWSISIGGGSLPCQAGKWMHDALVVPRRVWTIALSQLLRFGSL